MKTTYMYTQSTKVPTVEWGLHWLMVKKQTCVSLLHKWLFRFEILYLVSPASLVLSSCNSCCLMVWGLPLPGKWYRPRSGPMPRSLADCYLRPALGPVPQQSEGGHSLASGPGCAPNVPWRGRPPNQQDPLNSTGHYGSNKRGNIKMCELLRSKYVV